MSGLVLPTEVRSITEARLRAVQDRASVDSPSTGTDTGAVFRRRTVPEVS